MSSALQREIVNVITGFNKGTEGAIVIEKFKEGDGEVQKRARLISDPSFHFYTSKEPLDHYRTSLPKTMVDRIDCKYSERFEIIAELTNRKKMFRAADGDFRKLKKLNHHKDIHASDVNLSDYLIRKFAKAYLADGTLGQFHIQKSFFDIEVDTIDYDEGFPHPDLAPCPINFISYVDRDTQHIRMYVLQNFSNNPSMVEFYERNKGECSNFWNHKNNEYCRDALSRLFTDEQNPSNSMKRISVYWFKSELSLIKKFYEHVHQDKADYLGGWNSYFDFKTIYTRLKDHFGVNPADIMCPPEFKIRKINLREDTYSQDTADKSDTLEISGWPICADLKFYYASIRKGSGKKESLTLGDILLEELGEESVKGEYEGTIKDAVYVNFEKFFEYSAYDSYRLNQLEAKNNDIDMIQMISKLTYTRPSKVMRKTISIRNLAEDQFESDGLVLSNNQNAFIEHEDFGKFKGAFVAVATQVYNVGMMLNGMQSATVFGDTIDEDFTGLYPAGISAFQIGDETLIWKMVSSIGEINDRFGGLLNERDILQIGSVLFELPTLSDVLDDIDSLLVED